MMKTCRNCLLSTPVSGGAKRLYSYVLCAWPRPILPVSYTLSLAGLLGYHEDVTRMVGVEMLADIERNCPCYEERT